MSIRIVTCLDFDTDDPRIAYAHLRYLLANAEYETSDEWFDSAGEQMPVEEIQAIRIQSYIEGDNQS